MATYYYGMNGRISADYSRGKSVRRRPSARPKPVVRRPKSQTDIDIERAARRRRAAKVLGVPYETLVRRSKARRRLEAVLLDVGPPRVWLGPSQAARIP